MGDWTKGRLAAGLGVLIVTTAGVCVAQDSSAGLSILRGAAGFLTNVLGGFGTDALKNLHRSCFGPAGRAIDENHVILRQLREAQLKALREVAGRFEADMRISAGSEFFRGGEVFLSSLKLYLQEEQRIAKTLKESDLLAPAEADALSLETALARHAARTTDAARTASVLRAPTDFNTALSARHGGGPVLDAFREKATDVMLAELLIAVSDEIPTAFELLLKGGPDGIDGWFALFIRDAAARVRGVPGFRAIWQAEQEALLRVMLGETSQNVQDLRQLAQDSTQTLVRHGALLDAVADTTAKTQDLLRALADRLDDVSGWLQFNRNFAPKEWLRFHALNRAIPFQGREAELARLREFLNCDKDFSWWIVTGPGGAGKTRLALELCARMHARGWQVGFLRHPFEMPLAGWRPSRPMLIVADYATDQVDDLRNLALRLHSFGGGLPAIRLLLLERTVDEFFLNRLYGQQGNQEGAIRATQFIPDWLELPDLSEDDIWALVENCPWRDTLTKLPLQRSDFFVRLDSVDRNRRALVAMLIADDAASGDGSAGATNLPKILRKLLRNARAMHWPPDLGAKDEEIGEAQPADTLIAAATMTGRIDGDYLAAVEARLGAPVKGKVLKACAHAIGSPSYERRLDGIQPDLIGEYFALEALVGDSPALPAPWLPALAWRADERKMAGFVTRSVQNFSDHLALEQILITVPDVLESWWQFVLPSWAEADEATISQRIENVVSWLLPAARTDAGAAGAFARFCAFVSGFESGSVPLAVMLSLIDSLPGLSGQDDQRFREARAATLLNTLVDAKAEGDLPRRNALLQELRDLHEANPADTAVRRQLASGLFNAQIDASAEGDRPRRDALLQELRALHEANPADAAVRERLAMGLVNTRNNAKAEGDLPRRDALLQELRVLHEANPADTSVRRQLAMGLFNTRNNAKTEGDLPRRDALLQELRALHEANRADAAVREHLAMGLVNTQVNAKAEGDLPRRDALLQELRNLYEANPADAAVREPLAKGLFNTLVDAKEEGELSRRDALLQELRDLHEANPADAAVREQLAMGLVNTQVDAKAEGDLSRRDALLQELRNLHEANPADAAVRKRLANGFVNTLVDAKEEGELSRRDALLQELRDLQEANPADAAVREQLAMGLVNTLVDAKAEGDLPRRDALLQELRDLHTANPADADVREQLAKGLFAMLMEALEGHDIDVCDRVAAELRALAKVDIAHEEVRRIFTGGLVGFVLYLPEFSLPAEVEGKRGQELLDEAVRLAASFPDDEFLQNWLRSVSKEDDGPT